MAAADEDARLAEFEWRLLAFLKRCDGGETPLCPECIATGVRAEVADVEAALSGLASRELVAETANRRFGLTPAGEGRLAGTEPSTPAAETKLGAGER